MSLEQLEHSTQWLSNPQRDQVRALIAELRASRKVVEAARHIEIHWDSLLNGDLSAAESVDLEVELVAALAELSSINAMPKPLITTEPGWEQSPRGRTHALDGDSDSGE